MYPKNFVIKILICSYKNFLLKNSFSYFFLLRSSRERFLPQPPAIARSPLAVSSLHLARAPRFTSLAAPLCRAFWLYFIIKIFLYFTLYYIHTLWARCCFAARTLSCSLPSRVFVATQVSSRGSFGSSCLAHSRALAPVRSTANVKQYNEIFLMKAGKK